MAAVLRPRPLAGLLFISKCFILMRNILTMDFVFSGRLAMGGGGVSSSSIGIDRGTTFYFKMPYIHAPYTHNGLCFLGAAGDWRGRCFVLVRRRWGRLGLCDLLRRLEMKETIILIIIKKSIHVYE